MASQSSLEPVTESPSSAEDQIAQDRLVETETQTSGIPKPAGVTSDSRVLWEYLLPVIAFHLLIPLAFLPYLFSWWGVVWLFVGNYLFTSLGIGAGYHRLLTHRGFKCPRWFEYTLTTAGVCSFQDSPARWVLVHRIHHQHSDHQPDPHTPKVSAFWSHMGWLFVDNRQLSTVASYDKYVRDILRDPYYRWLQNGLNWVWVYAAHAFVITMIGYGIGALMTGTISGTIQVGMQFLFWGVIMRTIFTWHVTWGINSFSHMWGYRNYETREDSRNNWLFAFLTNGEGWHNNHHADPRSARHGHRWWEIDVTWISLVICEKLGIVSDLCRPNQSALDRKTIDQDQS
ncbi:MAG: acyl-CoA desaturase [Rubripirellula sp.]